MVEIKITENEAEQRLDRFLRKYLKDFSLGDIYKLFRKNKVKVNRKKVKENYMLALGDEIQLFVEAPAPTAPKKVQESRMSGKPVSVIYEDENILLADKPIGLLTHPDKPGDNDTLISRVLYYLKNKGEYDENASRTFSPSVCNRLDRNTGGIVIIAKNYTTLKAVNAAIREREVRKLYLCIVKGRMKGSGEIKNFLVKDEATNTVRITEEEAGEAKKVHTLYKTLKATDTYSLLEVELITGRSHQIRAHFSDIGHPLIGDTKYGDKNINFHFKGKHGLDHQFLYAYKVEFIKLPEELSYLQGRQFTAKLPHKLEAIRQELF